MRTFLYGAVILATVAAMALTGCGGDDSESSTSAQDRPSERQTTSPSTTATEPERARTDADADADADAKDRAAGSDSGGADDSGSATEPGAKSPGVADDTKADRAAAALAARTYFRSLGDGNGAKACSVLAADAREQLANSADAGSESAACIEAVEKASKGYTQDMRDGFASVDVMFVRLNAGAGIVTYQLEGSPRAELPVRRERGTWLVSTGG